MAWRSQTVTLVGRKTIVSDLIGTARASDTDVRKFVIAYFGCKDMKEAKGKSGEPGVLYGIKDDMWQAIAVCCYGYRLTQFEAATC